MSILVFFFITTNWSVNVFDGHFSAWVRIAWFGFDKEEGVLFSAFSRVVFIVGLRGCGMRWKEKKGREMMWIYPKNGQKVVTRKKKKCWGKRERYDAIESVEFIGYHFVLNWSNNNFLNSSHKLPTKLWCLFLHTLSPHVALLFFSSNNAAIVVNLFNALTFIFTDEEDT